MGRLTPTRWLRRWLITLVLMHPVVLLVFSHPMDQPTLRVSVSEDGKILLSWPAIAVNFVLEETSSLGSSWGPVPQPAQLSNGQFNVSLELAGSTRFYRLQQLRAFSTFTIDHHTPLDGAGEVGVTVRPQVFFSKPADLATVTSDSFFAQAGGAPLEATIVPANDGSFAWLFFKRAMPGGTRVRVSVDGSRVRSAESGELLDGDGDGAPGGVWTSEFTTVSRDALPGTSLAGVVVDPGPDFIPRTPDDLEPGADGQAGTADDKFLLPIQGVRVFLLGREADVRTTGADGRFHFDSVPVGNVKVVVNGTTAARAPAGFYFPEMVLDAQVLPGITNAAMTNGSEVYLPRLSQAILQTVDAQGTSLIKATEQGAQGLSAFQRNQLTIEVAANTLIGDNGQKLSSGQIGISTVPPDLVREMLPPGVLKHTFDLTVQAPGIAAFSTPAPMTFPNVFNAAPGSQLNFLSFDHTTGRLVIEGTATVSADGATVRTDPGTGITHPGWHGLTPPGAPNDPPEPPDPVCQQELLEADEREEPSAIGLQSVTVVKQAGGPLPETDGLEPQFFKSDEGSFTMRFRNAATPPPRKSKQICGPNTTGPKPLVIRIRVRGNERTKQKPNGFLEGLDETTLRPFLLRPGQEKKIKVTLTPLLKRVKEIDVDRLYGAKIFVMGWEEGKPQDLLLNKAFYVGRFLDAADAQHTDGILSMPDTATGAGGQPGVVRKRVIETRGVAFSLRRAGAAESPFSVTGTELRFAPTARGPRSTADLEVLDPDNRLIGTLQAEGEAKLQEFFVDSAKLREVLAEAAAGHIEGVTAEQKAFLTPSGVLDRIVSDTLKGVDALLSEYAQGISRATVDSAAGVKISAYRTADASNPESVDAVTLGRSDAVDICSLDGTVCLARGQEVVPHPLLELLKLVPKVSKTEFGFRLSKALNRRPQGSFEMYVDHFLTAKRPSGQPYVLTEDKLVAELVATIVHELGHTIGLIHTFNTAVARSSKGCGCALGENQKPLRDYRLDIMSHGELLGPPLFTVSGSAFQVALGLDFLPDEARRAINYFAANVRGAKGAKIKGILRGFDGNDGSDDYPLPEQPGSLLISLDSETPELAGSHNFGRVLADGPNGLAAERTLLFSNIGDTPITMRSARLVGSADFTIGGLGPGTQIPANESIAVVVRFDPINTGEAAATVELEHDGVQGSTEIDLSGFGLSPAADIRVQVENNNVGGTPMNGLAKSVRQFGSITNIGSAELVITGIANSDPSDRTFTVLSLPAGFGGTNPIRLQPGAGLWLDLAFLPTSTGLHRGEIHVRSNDPDTPVYVLSVVGTGLPADGSSLEYGNDFVAMESPDFPDSPVLRARTDDQGNFGFFLPADQRYHYSIFDPVSGLIAHGLGVTARSGSNTPIGVPVFLPSTAPDTDGDGLPDDVEFAIGSSRLKEDTDEDGMDDFVEIAQGLDPLGGRGLPVGIIGRVSLQGEAKEVVVIPWAGAGVTKLAVVAAGSGGLALVDVTQLSRPVVLNQLPLPGDATDVAVDPDLAMAVVAANDGGVHFVNISEPSAPVLIRTVSEAANQVEIFGGKALVAGRGRIARYDLLTETAPDVIDVTPLIVQSMAREGSNLYVVFAGSNTFRIVDLLPFGLRPPPSLVILPPEHIFVGNGIGYTTHPAAYDTINLADPDKPLRFNQSAAPRSDLQSRSLAVDAAGHGLLIGSVTNAGSEVSHHIDVLSVKDPTSRGLFQARIDVPSEAYHATIAAGFGYVAGGAAGLLIVNFSSIDTDGQPPTVRLTPELSDASPDKAGIQVEEGAFIPIGASVQDDVQVSQVELLVNGAVTQRSITLPFNFSAVAPAITEESSTFTLQARATDTGGNTAASEPLLVELYRNTNTLQIVAIRPAEGEVAPEDIGEARISFSKAVVPGSATLDNFSMTGPGGGKIMPLGIRLEPGGKEVVVSVGNLPPGEYTLTVRSEAIRDYAGKALGPNNLTSRFTIKAFTIRWTGLAGRAVRGFGQLWPFHLWRNATNWYPVRVPNANDSVYINATNVVVFLGAFSDETPKGKPLPVELASLMSNVEVALDYVDLHVKDFIQIRNLFTLNSSYLRDSVLLTGSNTVLRGYAYVPSGPLTDEGYSMLFDGVTMKGDFQLFGGSVLYLLNRLTLDGNLRSLYNPSVNSYGVLSIKRDTVIQGTGGIQDLPLTLTPWSLGPADESIPGPVATLSSNITCQGHYYVDLSGKGTTLINQGKMLLNDASSVALGDSGFTFQDTLGGQRFINEGLFEVSNGYRFTFTGTSGSMLMNRGDLRVRTGSTLRIGAQVNSPKTICEPGGTCYLFSRRLLTAPGGVSELSGAGNWLVQKMELNGGTVRMTDGAILEGDPIFNDVIFEGELRNYDARSRQAQIGFANTYGPAIVVRTNLTLNGQIRFIRQPTDGEGLLHFEAGDQRLQGQGRIEFESTNYFNQIGQLAGPQNFRGLSLTIGSGITVHGGSLNIGIIRGISPPDMPAAVVDNHGTILVDHAGDQLRLGLFAFTNSGSIHLGSSATVALPQGDFIQTMSGKLVFDVAGTKAAVTHGRFQMPSSQPTWDGTLKLNLIPPFQPSAGDIFELITFQSSIGSFSAIEAPALPAGRKWTPAYGTTSFRLTVE